MSDTQETNMIETISGDNDFFKQMVNLIPPKFYFDSETKEKLQKRKIEDISEDIEKDNKKAGDKRLAGSKSVKAQLKRAKFDPDQIKTVSQIQEELNDGALNSGKANKKKNKKERQNDSEDESLKSATDSLEELRERLHAKLAGLKAKRKVLGRDDWLERKRLKRQHKNTKQKIKKREKSDFDKSLPNGSASKKEKLEALPSKPVFNKEGKMVFSKFDFLDSSSNAKGDAPTGKNYKKLLEKVAKQKQKIKEVKDKDEAKGKTLEEKAAWKSVLQKAEGVKVKDNPELLKKSMKRAEKLKQKAGKKWDERKDKVDQRMKDKQSKRTKNIQKLKKNKIDSKIKKAKKKGRIMPGF